MGDAQTMIGRSIQSRAGVSRQGRPVMMYYFQGKTDRRALVIGGVHGTELSAIEVAGALVNRMNTASDTPEFSLLVIPELFPDNASLARNRPLTIGSTENIGRYTAPAAVDPNRQMPALGCAFDENNPVDSHGREIEPENRMLLKIIRDFAPERMVNLHAIRDVKFAGVFADPRTDEQLIAKGFATDSLLAIQMAKFIGDSAYPLPGNRLDSQPNALYVHDPAIAPQGSFQKRNICGACNNLSKGGVSLGGWASTAIRDNSVPNSQRDAITIITMEFPGCRRPQDHSDPLQADASTKMIGAFAGSIRKVFLN